MAIESICSGCGKLLRVQDEHAGKKARCPACKNVYLIAGQRTTSPQQPSEPTIGPSQHPPQAPTTANGIADRPERMARQANEPAARPETSRAAEPYWMFRGENGDIYGPVNREQLNHWAMEGRVSSQCDLQLVGGDSRWEPALGWIAPSLLTSDQREPQRQSAPQSGRQSTPAASSYDFGYRDQATPHRNYRSHRAGLIFLYGILGLGCPVFSILAWTVGYADLGRMNGGEMDPNGRALTQAGMVLGIASVSIQAFAIFTLLMNA